MITKAYVFIGSEKYLKSREFVLHVPYDSLLHELNNKFHL